MEKNDDRETYDMGQRLFDLITDAHINMSRRGLYHIMMVLARDFVRRATLEDSRAMVIQLEEDLGI